MSDSYFDVFISYCWKNQLSVRGVHNLDEQLRKRSYKVWIDKREMINGYLDEMMSFGVTHSDIFICCLTKEYQDSENCAKEFRLATSLDKPIIYVIFEDIKGLGNQGVLKLLSERNGLIRMHFANKMYYKCEDINGIEKAIKDELENKMRSLKQSSNPFKLISIDEKSKKLLLERNAIRFIKKIEGELSTLVVSGPTRSGKSYLLNRFLNKEAFKVLNTTDSCTRGVWLDNHCIQVPSSYNKIMQTVLVFDTEGLNEVGDNDTSVNQCKLFLFSILISSLFVYNTMGNIKRNDLNELSLNCQQAVNLLKRQNKSYNVFPTLFWILRDFTLQLKQGKTPNEYLNDELQKVPQSADCVKEVFQDRNCITVTQKGNKDFDKEMKNVCEVITRLIKPKVLETSPVNGLLFADYCERLVEALNDTKAIDLVSISSGCFESFADSVLQKALIECYEKIDSFFNEISKSPELDMEKFDSDLVTLQEECLNKAIKRLEQKIIGNADFKIHYLKKFKANVDKKLNNEITNVKNREIFENNLKRQYQIEMDKLNMKIAELMKNVEKLTQANEIEESNKKIEKMKKKVRDMEKTIKKLKDEKQNNATSNQPDTQPTASQPSSDKQPSLLDRIIDLFPDTT